jgi:hypothetical protein
LYVLDRFDVLMSKMIFKKWKNIIDMYFGTKNYLKSIHNHTAKHAFSPYSLLRACVQLSNGTHYPNIANFASQAHPRLLGSNKPTYKRPRSVCWKERPGSKNKNGLRFFFSESTINYHPRVCISVCKEKKSTFKITLMWFRIWVSWEFS